VPTATAAVATATRSYGRRVELGRSARGPADLLCRDRSVADALARSSIRGKLQANIAVAHLAERQPASASESLVETDGQHKRPLVVRSRLVRRMDAEELSRASRCPGIRGADLLSRRAALHLRATHPSCASCASRRRYRSLSARRERPIRASRSGVSASQHGNVDCEEPTLRSTRRCAPRGSRRSEFAAQVERGRRSRKTRHSSSASRRDPPDAFSR
jgi:hypothetical protein